MPNESSDSVKITWFDREATPGRLRKAVRKLAELYPEVEAVILFGFIARGDCVPGSDADLLIILKESDLPFLKRIPKYLPPGCEIDVDVFPYTKAEIDKMLRRGNNFIREALAEGISIFVRGNLTEANLKGRG